MNHKISQNKVSAFLIPLLCVALAICGCDSHKGERESLRKQIASIETDLSPLKEAQARVSKEIEVLTSEIKLRSDNLQQHVNRQTKLKDEMALYVLDHKLATLAVAATIAGIAAALDNNM